MINYFTTNGYYYNYNFIIKGHYFSINFDLAHLFLFIVNFLVFLIIIALLIIFYYLIRFIFLNYHYCLTINFILLCYWFFLMVICHSLNENLFYQYYLLYPIMIINFIMFSTIHLLSLQYLLGSFIINLIKFILILFLRYWMTMVEI